MSVSNGPAAAGPGGAPPVAADVHGMTHAGRVRTANEDQFFIATLHKSMRVEQTSLEDQAVFERLRGSSAHLLVVADGASGLAGARQASGAAVETLAEHIGETIGCYYSADVDREHEFLAELQDAVERAHRQVMKLDPTRSQGPATTLTMVAVIWPRAYVVHVGDSRAYYLRAGRLRQLTRDQTAYEDLLDQGLIDEDDAQDVGLKSRLKNVLTSALGAQIKPATGLIDLEPGVMPSSRRPHAGARRARQRDGDRRPLRGRLKTPPRRPPAPARRRAGSPSSSSARAGEGDGGARERTAGMVKLQGRTAEEKPGSETAAAPARDDGPEVLGGGNLDQVREILFGAQSRGIDKRLARLEEELPKRIADVREELKRGLANLEAYARKEIESLNERLAAETRGRDEGDEALGARLDEASKTIRKDLAQLADRSTAAQRELRQQLLDQAKRLEEEIQRRGDDLAAALARAVEELRVEKADRKAVAAILHEVAMRLTDEFTLPLADGA
jgi:serine/threonine protein phosphatase PrpC